MTFSPKNIAAHIAGAVSILGAAGWLYLDVRPDGHVELSTAAGVAALGLVGGFLIDKAGLGELIDFGIAKWKAFRGTEGSAGESS